MKNVHINDFRGILKSVSEDTEIDSKLDSVLEGTIAKDDLVAVTVKDGVLDLHVNPVDTVLNIVKGKGLISDLVGLYSLGRKIWVSLKKD